MRSLALLLAAACGDGTVAAMDSAAGDARPPDSAGQADAAPPDAPPDPCAGAFLCDDFEGYAPGGDPGGPWSVSTNMGEVAVDTAMARSGTNAIHVTTDPGGGTYRRAYLTVTGAPTFPRPTNDFYGRMMVYLVAAPTDTVHWSNIQGEGDVPGVGFRANVRYGGQVMKQLMANYDTSGVSSDCWQHSTTAIPEGRWTCMEWEFDGPNDTQRFWLDGVAIDALTVVGSGQGCIAHDTGDHWYAPTYDTLRLGWEHYQAFDHAEMVGSSRVDLQACKLEYSIVSPK